MRPRGKGGVVNERLIVHGSTNLRVVDASIVEQHNISMRCGEGRTSGTVSISSDGMEALLSQMPGSANALNEIEVILMRSTHGQ